jgi:hypothetical protein
MKTHLDTIVYDLLEWVLPQGSLRAPSHAESFGVVIPIYILTSTRLYVVIFSGKCV